MEQIDILINSGKRREAARLIQQCIANKIDFGGNRVRYAHVLVSECDWDSVNKLLPPEMNMLTTSGWLDSLIAGRPVNGSGVPIPWMNYSAIDFIGSKIKSSHRVFEWGAGFSSLWFASKVKEVISAEDNLEWYEEINKKTPPNLHIIKATTKQYYIDSISNQPDNFDVVVIDGSHRNQCANVCIKKLNQDGFIIFDNSDSKEYDESMHYFDENGFFRIDFWGLIPSYFYKNCTSIIFRDPGFLRYSTPPSCQVLSSGISCFQAYDKGIGESELGKP